MALLNYILLFLTVCKLIKKWQTNFLVCINSPTMIRSSDNEIKNSPLVVYNPLLTLLYSLYPTCDFCLIKCHSSQSLRCITIQCWNNLGSSSCCNINKTHIKSHSHLHKILNIGDRPTDLGIKKWLRNGLGIKKDLGMAKMTLNKLIYVYVEFTYTYLINFRIDFLNMDDANRTLLSENINNYNPTL